MINHNGQLLPAHQPVFAHNNRLRMGDGFFETIRLFSGKVAFVQQHFERIVQSCVLYQMELPSHFTLNYFTEAITQLAQANGLQHGRLRVQFYRQGGGRYLPLQSSAGFVMEIEDDGYKQYELSILPKVGFSTHSVRLEHSLGTVKSSSAIMSVVAALEAQNRGVDELLINNHKGYLCEAIAANVFVVKNVSQWITPPLSSGCVDGVMRRMVISLADAAGVEVQERPISPQEVQQSAALLLTNASKGIQWVQELEGRTLQLPPQAHTLTALLNSAVV